MLFPITNQFNNGPPIDPGDPTSAPPGIVFRGDGTGKSGKSRISPTADPVPSSLSADLTAAANHPAADAVEPTAAGSTAGGNRKIATAGSKSTAGCIGVIRAAPRPDQQRHGPGIRIITTQEKKER